MGMVSSFFVSFFVCLHLIIMLCTTQKKTIFKSNPLQIRIHLDDEIQPNRIQFRPISTSAKFSLSVEISAGLILPLFLHSPFVSSVLDCWLVFYSITGTSSRVTCKWINKFKKWRCSYLVMVQRKRYVTATCDIIDHFWIIGVYEWGSAEKKRKLSV